MISNVKYRNKWFHDARRHKFIRLRNSNARSRKKRYARKTQDLWQNWRKRIEIPTTSYPVTTKSESTTFTVDTVGSPTAAYEDEVHHQTTPRPIFIPTSEKDIYSRLTNEPTRRPNRRPNYSKPTYTTKMATLSTTKSTVSTSTSTSTYSIPQQPKNSFRKVRVEPGTILMMNSTYLYEKYISTRRATTFHRALLMDYFGLSETEMERMGMTVVAWGFSYQVKDKKSTGHNEDQAEKFFCDFKFRSSTFNAGYVGAKVNIEFTEFDG